MVQWWLAWFTTLAAAGLGWFWHWHVVQTNRRSGARMAEDLVNEARREAEVIRREAETSAREAMVQDREAFENAYAERRKRIEEREERFARQLESLKDWENLLESKQVEVRNVLERQQRKLSDLSGLSPEQARSELLARLERDLRAEQAEWVQKVRKDVEATAADTARNVLAGAIERYAAPTVQQITLSKVHLPSDEVKGRIIGKDGRNIRSLESETGVTLIIDDTPESVGISSYDPLRREVARIALERLIDDGRIHPASIEETVRQVRAELDETLVQTGRDAVGGLGLRDVDPALFPLLGRLKFRTSYTQNVLTHSVEMAHLMGMLAGELGLDTSLAKRIGLFHDLGKGLTHESEVGHARAGAALLEQHGENALVVNAVAAHHKEVEAKSIYAVLTCAADAITAARPGARSDTLAQYVERLGNLEEIANAFPGVQRSYAIQAGRELRVIVEPRRISDAEAQLLARDIAAKISGTLGFPGQIKVTVIRETRVVEYAR